MNERIAVKWESELLLAARLFLVLLFVIFGWGKLMDYSGTLHYMMHVGAPFPPLATIVAIVMELFVPVALILGVATRPLSILLAIYTLGTGIIGHHYWTMTGMDRFENEINFWKNISIVGGLLFLYVAGPGKYAIRIGR